MFRLARSPALPTLPAVHRVVLLLWTALFLTFGLLNSAGAVEHTHRRPSHASGHREIPTPSRTTGEHEHVHPCPCSALCQLPDGRVLAALPAPPEWDLLLPIRLHVAGPAAERFAGQQEYLFPYPTGPPHVLI